MFFLIKIRITFHVNYLTRYFAFIFHVLVVLEICFMPERLSKSM